MAVPVITQMTPTTGPAGGRTVVKISGSNFAVPPEPPSNTPWQQTIQVLFNGVASEKVLPYGSDLVACVSPPFVGAFLYVKPSDGPPNTEVLVSITLRNLDPDTGDPVPGEEITVTDAWTYTRGTEKDDAAKKWISRYVGYHLQRQTVDNVVIIAAHPDWDPDQGTAEIEIQTVPALVLTPRVERKQFLGSSLADAGAAEKPKVTDTTTYPVTAGTGAMLVLVDRAGLDDAQRVVFAGTETTAVQIATIIDAQLTGATAAEDGGQVYIESDTEGGVIQVLANPSANPLLTFSTSEVIGTPEEQMRRMGGRWVDIAFDVRGVEHQAGRLLTLSDMFIDFIERGMVPIPQTIGDTDSDLLWLEIVMVTPPAFPDVPEGNSLLKEFMATFVVQNVVLSGGEIAALSEDFHTYKGTADVDLDMEKSDT